MPRRAALAFHRDLGFDSNMASAAEPLTAVRRATAALTPAAVPGILVAAVVTIVGLAEGGLFPRTWRLVTIALLVFAAAGLLARERIVVSRLEWAMLGGLAAFTGWIALSATWSEHSESAVLESERSLAYLAAVFALVLLSERASLLFVLVGLLAAVTVVAGYGLALYLFTSPPLDQFQGRLLFRPVGYANALGIFAAVGILVSVGLADSLRRPRARVAALAPLAVLIPTLALTSSRGAWMALAAGAAAYLLLSGRTRLAVAAVVVGALPALVALTRFVGDNRVDYWRVAWRQFEDNPFLGAGAGTYVDYWFRYRSLESFTRTSHNLYLETLGELGPLGLLLLLATLAVPFVALVRRRDRLVAAATAAYVAYVLHTAVDWDWELPASTLPGLVCGVAVLTSTRPDAKTPLSSRSRAALLICALLLAVFAAVRLRTGGELPFGA